MRSQCEAQLYARLQQQYMGDRILEDSIQRCSDSLLQPMLWDLDLSYHETIALIIVLYNPHQRKGPSLL